MAANPDPDTTIELSRDYAAPRHRVFDIFFDSEALTYVFSADAYTVVEMDIDPRVGGGWSLAMRDEATGEVNHCTARYVAIDRPKRIVWLSKWSDGPLADAEEMRITLEFENCGRGTRLKLTHEFFPDSTTRDRQALRWAAEFEQLEDLLAGEQKIA